MNRFSSMATFRAHDAEQSLRPLVARGPRRFQLAFGQVSIDLIALLCGFATADRLVPQGNEPHPMLALVSSLVLLYVMSGLILRAFSTDGLVRRSQSVLRAVGALAFSATLFTFLLFVLKVQVPIPRLDFFVGVTSAAVLLAATRFLYGNYAMRALGGSLYTTVILLDRAGGHVRPIQAVQPGTTLIDISDLFDPALAGPHEYDSLARLIGQADRVVVSCSVERRAHWAHALRGMNVHAEVVAPELNELDALGIAQQAGQTTLVLARGPLGLRARLFKRAFDLSFAFAALLFLSPLLLVTAIAIKLDSRGPVFFRQPRIGRQNRVFYVYKFRSMHVNQLDAGGHTSTSRRDPRITRVGQFIRASSIDELPQLLNVLFGDMSVVGPRPHAVYSTAEELLFWEIDRRYWHRHACKPGITGLAQIKGLRGATEVTSDLTNRVSADLEYINTWSFLGDLVIIARTFTVIFHPNAY